MSGERKLIEAILVMDESGITNQMLYPEFESLLNDAMRLPDHADQQLHCVYVLVNPALQAEGLVFFYLDVNANGQVDRSWDVPLRHLLEKSDIGPNMGAGPIKLVCASQTPMPWQADALWNPNALFDRDDFDLIKQTLAEDKVGVSHAFEVEPVDYQIIQNPTQDRWLSPLAKGFNDDTSAIKAELERKFRREAAKKVRHLRLRMRQSKPNPPISALNADANQLAMIAELNAELDVQQSKLASQERLKEQLIAESEAHQQTRKVLTGRMNELEVQLKNSLNHMSGITQAVPVLEQIDGGQIQAMQAHIAELSKKLETSESMLRRTTSSLSALHAKSRDEQSGLQASNLQLQAKIEELERLSDTVNATASASSRDEGTYKEIELKLRNDAALLLSRQRKRFFQKIQRAQNTLKETIESHEAKLLDMEQDIQLQRDTQGSSNSRNDVDLQLKEVAESYQHQIDALKDELASVNAKWQEQLSSKDALLEELNHELDTVQHQNEVIQSNKKHIKDLSTQIEVLKKELAHVQKSGDIEESSQSLSGAQLQNEFHIQRQEARDRVARRLVRLRNRLHQSVAESRRIHTNEINQIKSTIEALMIDVKHSENRLRNEILSRDEIQCELDAERNNHQITQEALKAKTELEHQLRDELSANADLILSEIEAHQMRLSEQKSQLRKHTATQLLRVRNKGKEQLHVARFRAAEDESRFINQLAQLRQDLVHADQKVMAEEAERAVLKAKLQAEQEAHQLTHRNLSEQLADEQSLNQKETKRLIVEHESQTFDILQDKALSEKKLRSSVAQLLVNQRKKHAVRTQSDNQAQLSVVKRFETMLSERNAELAKFKESLDVERNQVTQLQAALDSSYELSESLQKLLEIEQSSHQKLMTDFKQVQHVSQEVTAELELEKIAKHSVLSTLENSEQTCEKLQLELEAQQVQLNKMQKEHQDQLQQMRFSNLESHKKMEANFKLVMEDAGQSHIAEMALLIQKFESQLRDQEHNLTQSYKTEMDALNSHRENVIAEFEASLKEAMQQIKDKDEEILALNNDHQQSITEINNEQAKQLAKMQSVFALDIQAKINQFETEHFHTLEAHDKTLQTLTLGFEEEKDQIRQLNIDAMKDVEQRHSDLLSELNDELDSIESKLKIEKHHSQEMLTKIEQLNHDLHQAKNDYDTSIQSWNDEKYKLESSLAALIQKNQSESDDFQQHINKLQDALNHKSHQLSEMSENKKALQAANLETVAMLEAEISKLRQSLQLAQDIRQKEKLAHEASMSGFSDKVKALEFQFKSQLDGIVASIHKASP